MMVAAEPDVTRQCQSKQIGNRVQSGVADTQGDDGRKGQTDDVVGQHGTEHGAEPHAGKQEKARPMKQGAAAQGGPSVEPAQAQLGRYDHQCKKEQNRAVIDGRQGGVHRQCPAGHHSDGAQQGDTGSIQGEAGNPAQGHPEIGQHEDKNGQKAHGGGSVWRTEHLLQQLGGAPRRIGPDGGFFLRQIGKDRRKPRNRAHARSGRPSDRARTAGCCICP